jgi:hypothetical protein
MDFAEAIDLEFGRTRRNDPKSGIGDVSTHKLRKVALGQMTAQEFADERRASLENARRLYEGMFGKEKAKP